MHFESLDEMGSPRMEEEEEESESSMNLLARLALS